MNKYYSIFSIIVLCISIYFLHNLSGNSYDTSDDNKNISNVVNNINVEIGDKLFIFPINYLWGKDDRVNGKQEAINLHVPLSEFNIAKKNNMDDVNSNNMEVKLKILLHEHNIVNNDRNSHSMSKLDVYERIIQSKDSNYDTDSIDKEGPSGLIHKKWIDSNRRSNELYVGTKNNGNLYWVKCSPESVAMNPYCNTVVEYSKYVYVTYSFPKKYLPSWQALEASIINFIRNYENGEYGEKK